MGRKVEGLSKNGKRKEKALMDTDNSEVIARGRGTEWRQKRV